MFFEPIEHVATHTIANAERMAGDASRQVKRSMIHPQYARRFIKQFLISEED